MAFTQKGKLKINEHVRRGSELGTFDLIKAFVTSSAVVILKIFVWKKIPYSLYTGATCYEYRYQDVNALCNFVKLLIWLSHILSRKRNTYTN